MKRTHENIYPAKGNTPHDFVFFQRYYPFDIREGHTEKHYFIFLTEGTILCSFNGEKLIEQNSPSMFLLPKGSIYKLQVANHSSITIIPVISPYFFSSVLNKEEYKNNTQPAEYGFALKINTVILKFLYLFSDFYLSGFSDSAYLELKMTELLFLIDKIYQMSDKLRFYSPIIDEEFLFADKLIKNYKQARTAKELAEFSFYSLSGFEKKFRKYFGLSAAQWLKQQKKTDIYHDLLNSDKTFKEISAEYGFCSVTHFNNYCKTALGDTPGKLRKKILTSVFY
ncbi:MAG: AraC family transcriptional regulator [Massilibacteroides sp.]|nr:AraC family transcriptional regulator [Massilibacteroides sp.]